MYARAIDDAATRLRHLRREEWGDFALGALVLGLALAATHFEPAFALPLFAGGLVVVLGGIRAAWRRWDLVDRLVADRDAYAIKEVRAHAERQSTPERRSELAAAIRRLVDEPSPALEEWPSELVTDLEALAGDLENAQLVLDPASAVACARLLSDPNQSPLFDAFASPAALRQEVRRIRFGFASRR